MVTGESMPVTKEPGSRVIGAHRSTARGTLLMRADRVGSATVLAQIVAHGRRCAANTGADSTAGRPDRGAISSQRSAHGALLAFVAWSLWGPEPRLAHGLRQRRGGADHRVSVRARPRDADGDHGGTGRGASAGVLVRNAEALERLETIDVLVVDKTGTLTEGRPS